MDWARESDALVQHCGCDVVGGDDATEEVAAGDRPVSFVPVVAVAVAGGRALSSLDVAGGEATMGNWCFGGGGGSIDQQRQRPSARRPLIAPGSGLHRFTLITDFSYFTDT